MFIHHSYIEPAYIYFFFFFFPEIKILHEYVSHKVFEV